MDALQITGGIILCAGYIPQIRRILKSRSAHDLSLSMWVSVLIGLILMEAYAVYLFATSGGPAVLITNSVSLTFAVGMVALILVYGRRPTLAVAAIDETFPEELALSPVEGAQAA
ncbi:MAG: PQ-loop repeat-containing protein [Coriobacteriia bacterium]|nr:PQ-loop repeat-containing protein [Coriobacteriia bacterium]